ncbi:MAG: alpha-amylase family glycosyl hydrolase [Bacteroidales bacterium]|nr:alpha-amylase family glycosyl hydrolase [Bacteroidales bacterium]
MKENILIYQVLPRYWGTAGETPRPGVRCGHFSEFGTDFFDYMKWLGCTHVWYTGIPRHSQHPGFTKGDAGSPYAISDWFDVNPYLADDPGHRMDEFEDLVRRTHAASLKVIMDFIPNHVARDYKASSGVSLGENDDTSVHWSPENDFYYYPSEALVLPNGSSFREFPAKASGNAFTSSPGINDWYETLRINYCPFHTGTWDKMLSVLEFWASKGVDGFRCDMVEMVPPEFMQWAIGSIRKKYPQMLFVAEVYSMDNYSKYLNDVGFDLLYDKSGMYDTLQSVMRGNTPAEGITGVWQHLGSLQDGMLNFLENHDEPRLASSFVAGSPKAALCALGVSALLSPASFMIYAGQEIGERGMYEEGFSGLDGKSTIFDWWTIDSVQRLRSVISSGAYGCSSISDMKNAGLSIREAELLNRYGEVLRLKSTCAAFGPDGRMHDLMYAQGPEFDSGSIFAFARYTEDEFYVVASNFSPEKKKITVTLPSCLTSEDAILPHKIEMTCPARDFSIQKLK